MTWSMAAATRSPLRSVAWSSAAASRAPCSSGGRKGASGTAETRGSHRVAAAARRRLARTARRRAPGRPAAPARSRWPPPRVCVNDTRRTDNIQIVRPAGIATRPTVQYPSAEAQAPLVRTRLSVCVRRGANRWRRRRISLPPRTRRRSWCWTTRRCGGARRDRPPAPGGQRAGRRRRHPRGSCAAGSRLAGAETVHGLGVGWWVVQGPPVARCPQETRIDPVPLTRGLPLTCLW
jgi:hypothetical protein